MATDIAEKAETFTVLSGSVVMRRLLLLLLNFNWQKSRQNVIPEIHGVALGGCWTWVERVFILPNIVTASL